MSDSNAEINAKPVENIDWFRARPMSMYGSENGIERYRFSVLGPLKNAEEKARMLAMIDLFRRTVGRMETEEELCALKCAEKMK